MRRYETIFIVKSSTGEDEITAILDKVESIITGDGGTVLTIDKWGLKKLAYLIKKEAQGYYVYIDYAAVPAAVAEIERKFRIDDAVLKYMTIKKASSISAEQIDQAIGDVSAREIEAQETEPAEGTDLPEKQVPVTEPAVAEPVVAETAEADSEDTTENN